MKLADLTLPISYAEARQYALVFTPALANRLLELHGLYGSNKCKPVPRILTNGRPMLSADVLTEVEPGGPLHGMWRAADRAVLNASVDVIPWSEAVALLPVDNSPA